MVSNGNKHGDGVIEQNITISRNIIQFSEIPLEAKTRAPEAIDVAYDILIKLLSHHCQVPYSASTKKLPIKYQGIGKLLVTELRKRLSQKKVD